MDMTTAKRFADEYGINPRAFPSGDAFVAAVEHEFDRRIKESAERSGRERDAQWDALLQISHGHEFCPDTLLCRKCGISNVGYLMQRSGSVRPLELLCR